VATKKIVLVDLYADDYSSSGTPIEQHAFNTLLLSNKVA